MRSSATAIRVVPRSIERWDRLRVVLRRAAIAATAIPPLWFGLCVLGLKPCALLDGLGWLLGSRDAFRGAAYLICLCCFVAAPFLISGGRLLTRELDGLRGNRPPTRVFRVCAAAWALQWLASWPGAFWILAHSD